MVGSTSKKLGPYRPTPLKPLTDPPYVIAASPITIICMDGTMLARSPGVSLMYNLLELVALPHGHVAARMDRYGILCPFALLCLHVSADTREKKSHHG